MPSSELPLRKRLSYRQTRNTVLVAFVIGLVLSSLQIFLDYFSQRSERRELVGNLLDAANHAAYHAAYNLDDRGATQIALGLVSNPPVVSARIFDNTGELLGQAQGLNHHRVSSAQRWLFGPVKSLSIQLLDKAQFEDPVGQLVVEVDPALSAKTFMQRSLVVFASGVLRNFFLALCILLVFYYSITRPILQAAKPLKEGFGRRRIPVPKDHEENEIGLLLNAFNQHLDIIDQQHAQIIAANTVLEQQVQERTAELGEKNKELEKEREIALSASRAKSDFLAMMSHEIRTPMHGVLGMVELLQQSTLDQQQRTWVEAVLDAGQSLQSMMNSVLDYARLEQGKITVEHIAFDVSRLLRGIVFLLSPLADEKALVVRTDIAPDVPSCLVGDPDKLRQVLLNLLTNAIKFTHEGEIVVTVLTLKKNEKLTLQFAVTDTGVGLSTAAQEQVFEPFSQADSSISRRYGGSGLGLAIVKDIVEHQGGSVGVESREGHGSRFWFELPLEPCSDDMRAQAFLSDELERSDKNTNEMSQARVLVVDDVAINRLLCKGQLNRHHVVMASNGLEAIDRVKEQPLDVILMDLHMPELDGISATRLIRELPGQGAFLPIVGVTANVTPAVVTRCLEAGMDSVVSKPLGRSGLIKVVQSCMPKAQVQKSEERTPLLDKETVQSHFEVLGEQAVKSLYRDAIESAQTHLAALEQSWREQGDITGMAHTLAGLSGNFGFLLLAQLMASIETNPAGFNEQKLSQIKQVYADTTTALSLLETLGESPR